MNWFKWYNLKTWIFKTDQHMGWSSTANIPVYQPLESTCAFFIQGFEASWNHTCWAPEEDNEQPSRNEGPAGKEDGAIVIIFFFKMTYHFFKVIDLAHLKFKPDIYLKMTQKTVVFIMQQGNIGLSHIIYNQCYILLLCGFILK